MDFTCRAFRSHGATSPYYTQGSNRKKICRPLRFSSGYEESYKQWDDYKTNQDHVEPFDY